MSVIYLNWRNVFLFMALFNVVVILQYTMMSISSLNQEKLDQSSHDNAQNYMEGLNSRNRKTKQLKVETDNTKRYMDKQNLKVSGNNININKLNVDIDSNVDKNIIKNSQSFKINNVNNHGNSINNHGNSMGNSYIEQVRSLSRQIVVSKDGRSSDVETGNVVLFDPHAARTKTMTNNNIHKPVKVDRSINNTINSDNIENINRKSILLQADGSSHNVNQQKLQSPHKQFLSNFSFAKTPNETKQEELYYKKRTHVVNLFNHTYVIKPSKEKCFGGVFLVMLVHSKPSYHERRDAIRKSWGSVAEMDPQIWPPNYELEAKVSLLFVTGIDKKDNSWNDMLALENKMYGDVLQGDFIDDYKNMTLKSLLGLKYVSEHCTGNSVPYMLKSDDDMFINIPFLIKTLREKLLERSIMGPFNLHSKVYRRGKWKLTREVFPFDWFPPYESGSAYIITMDIVRELYDASQYMPWIFIDDVYITGILARVIGAKHEYRVKMFSYWTDKAPQPCDIISNKKITFTKCSPVLLGKLWGAIQQKDLYKC